jgi:hypothetical protein
MKKLLIAFSLVFVFLGAGGWLTFQKYLEKEKEKSALELKKRQIELDKTQKAFAEQVKKAPDWKPLGGSQRAATSSKASLELLIKISDIAGRTPDEVSKILDSPTSKETVNPSRTPCPCEKNIYKDGKIEIVYMNEKADWITVNLPASKVDISGSYLSVQQFDNPTYTYVKAITN